MAFNAPAFAREDNPRQVAATPSPTLKELKEKLAKMTPEERKAYFRNNPEQHRLLKKMRTRSPTVKVPKQK